ncbi:toxic protein SymE [Lachnospiraceae bacterium NK3A20]|nr:toxic protein SymE [Lachnospiraceae bacterium NK3A20]
MKQKKIKVQYRSRATAHGYTDTPMIQMAGNWLEALGFSIGDTIMMEYDEDGIRIQPLTLEEQAEAEKAELEFSIRQKQKELKSMQKRSGADRRRTVMVAESVSRYSDTVPV